MLQLVPVLMLSFAEPKWVSWEVWAARPLIACTARMYQHKVGRQRYLAFQCYEFGGNVYRFDLTGAQKA